MKRGRRPRRRAAPRDNRVADWQIADTDDARVRRSTLDADGATDDDADDAG